MAKPILEGIKKLGNLYEESFGCEPGYVLVLYGARYLTNYWHYDDALPKAEERRILVQALSGDGMQILPEGDVVRKNLLPNDFQKLQDALALGRMAGNVLVDALKTNSYVNRHNLVAKKTSKMYANFLDARNVGNINEEMENSEDADVDYYLASSGKKKNRIEDPANRFHNGSQIIQVMEGDVVAMCQMGAQGAVHRGSQIPLESDILLYAAPPLKRQSLAKALNRA